MKVGKYLLLRIWADVSTRFLYMFVHGPKYEKNTIVQFIAKAKNNCFYRNIFS